MSRSEEAEAWANAVYAAVQEIPRGKVTTYGHIALLLGERTYPPAPRLTKTSDCTATN
jgi:methylated-DNA-protein-cysteine methyltransferase-like protein